MTGEAAFVGGLDLGVDGRRGLNDFLDFPRLKRRFNVPPLVGDLEPIRWISTTCMGEALLIISAFSSAESSCSGDLGVSKSKFNGGSERKYRLSWCFDRSKSAIMGTDISDAIREWPAVEAE